MALIDGIEGYWKCDAGSGNRFDAHVNSLDFIETGFVPSVVGKILNAVDGTGNPVNFLDQPFTPRLVFADEAMAISCWANINAGQQFANHPIFSVWEAAGSNLCYLLWFRTSVQRWQWRVSNNGVTVVELNSAAAPPFDGTFQHLVAQHDPIANLITLQIDDGAIQSLAHTTGLNGSSTARPGLGITDQSGSPIIHGAHVDEIGVWRRNLTTAEVTLLNNGGNALDFSQFASVNPPVLEEPIVVIELEQDQCRLLYGVSPCTAALGTTGTRKCYNTRSTCQDRENYDTSPTVSDQKAVSQDISNAGAQEATKDVSTEDPIPTGLTFKPDGTKLYIVGQSNDQIRQYPLTTPWDIATAGAVEASFSVAGADNAPQAVFWKSDGLKVYIVGVQNDQVRQYIVTTPFDLSTVGALEASHSVAGEDTSPQGLFFKSDGTKLYVCGSTSNKVHQYPLSTAWDISTAGTVEESFDVSGEELDPHGIYFGAQGTKLYVIGAQSNTVHQYPLSTAWDISTAGTVEESFDVSGEESFSGDLTLSVDGSKLYVVGVSGFVRQYPIAGVVGGVARDATGTGAVATAGAVEASFDVSTEETSPRGLFFKSDGTKLYVVGITSDQVRQYPLTTAWDISTAGSVEASFDVSTEEV
ncbi:MAG: hypothetical protein V3S94_05190, partial [Gammaproteobacteria bacterium]